MSHRLRGLHHGSTTCGLFGCAGLSTGPCFLPYMGEIPSSNVVRVQRDAHEIPSTLPGTEDAKSFTFLRSQRHFLLDLPP